MALKNLTREKEPEEREVGAVEILDTGALAAMNKSEIDQQIATAHKYPRSLAKFKRDATDMVTMTEETAQDCIYALPRAGEVIEGPSVRFAEIIFNAWGNCRAGSRVTNDDGTYVYAQGAFHDLEKNAAYAFEVPRRVVDKVGRRYTADMVGMTISAASSIALRNAILKGIPKALWNSIYQTARATVMGDYQTLPNRRAKLLDAFQAYGMTREMVLKLLPNLQGIEDIGLDKMVHLGGFLNALKEGDATVESLLAATNPDNAPATQTEPASTAPKPPPAKPAETQQQTADKPKDDPKPEGEKIPLKQAQAEAAAGDAGPIPDALRRDKKAAAQKPAPQQAAGEPQPLIDDSSLDDKPKRSEMDIIKELRHGLEAAIAKATGDNGDDGAALQAWQNSKTVLDLRKALSSDGAKVVDRLVEQAWEKLTG